MRESDLFGELVTFKLRDVEEFLRWSVGGLLQVVKGYTTPFKMFDILNPFVPLLQTFALENQYFNR